jgi:hypothetical protein
MHRQHPQPSIQQSLDQQLLARLIAHAHVVLVRPPVTAGIPICTPSCDEQLRRASCGHRREAQWKRVLRSLVYADVRRLFTFSARRAPRFPALASRATVASGRGLA